MAASRVRPPAKLKTPFTFSQSSLQDYADCPRRFRLRCIEQMKWPAAESEPVAEFEVRQEEGLTFHRLIQQHLLGLPAQRLMELANTPNLKRWWKNYAATNFGLEDYAQRTELVLVCAIGEHRLLAKFDLVAVKDGSALIYDWKTSARRPRDEWLASRWQTRIYRALMAKAGASRNGRQPFEPAHIKMVYWFSEFPNESAQFTYDAQQHKRDWSAIEKLIQEIATAEDFPLTEDRKMCRFCVYRSYCDRGGPAAGSLDAEVDADAGDAFDVNFEQIGEIEY
jgi:CRISPR/Cas system-associated exonuclease Cas4 (RecB family)